MTLEKAVSERLWNTDSFDELPHHMSRSSQQRTKYRNYATSPWGTKMQDPRSLPSTSESPLGRLDTATTGPSAMLHW